MTKVTVPELDALAAEHHVDDYPADGKKDEKIAALEAAGVEIVAGERFRFRLTDKTCERLSDESLRDELRVVRFWADGKRVELTADDDTFETTDADVARGLRDLPMLEEIE